MPYVRYSTCISDLVSMTIGSFNVNRNNSEPEEPEVMADGKMLSLLSVPSRSQSRGQQTKSTSRHPGYSLFEWNKLCESRKDMSGTGGRHLNVTAQDLAKHNTEEDCWTSIRGKVYNVTPFLKYHPGRKSQLMRGAGNDCTSLFDQLHTWVNEATILKHCLVGTLIPGNTVATYHQCTIAGIEDVTHDIRLFTLHQPSGSPICARTGQHVKMQAMICGKLIEREYTPVELLINCGQHISSECVLLMIKLYSHGKMTQHLSQANIGDILSIREPCGEFSVHKLSLAKKVVLIAGGSGFTPMVKLINGRLAMQKHNEELCMSLIFANKTEEDIIWREQLQHLRESFPRFDVVNILSSPSEKWRGEKGRVTHAFLAKYLPPPTQDMLICISGPVQFAGKVSRFLFDMKYPDDVIHSFD